MVFVALFCYYFLFLRDFINGWYSILNAGLFQLLGVYSGKKIYQLWVLRKTQGSVRLLNRVSVDLKIFFFVHQNSFSTFPNFSQPSTTIKARQDIKNLPSPLSLFTLSQFQRKSQGWLPRKLRHEPKSEFKSNSEQVCHQPCQDSEASPSPESSWHPPTQCIVRKVRRDTGLFKYA